MLRMAWALQAEAAELARSERWINDDDHLQEEEDKVGASSA